MTYQRAKQCFDDTRQHIGSPTKDAVTAGIWNLSSGLALLAEAIAHDFGDLQSRVVQIEKAVQALRQQK